jgi:hypothetical protein
VKQPVLPTPHYTRQLGAFVDEYASRGAVRLLARLAEGHGTMLENLARFEAMAPARRRKVAGRTITVREYLLDAGAREFLVLYWVPPEASEPILLLNLRIGGQNRYRWPRRG